MLSRFFAIGVVLMSVILIASPSGIGQQFKKKDPKVSFEEKAKGRGYFLISEVNDWRKDALEKFAKDKGITDGKITLDQYLAFSEQMRAMFQGMKKGPKGEMKSAADAFIKKAEAEKPAEKPPTADELDKMAAEEFERRDLNGDGVLNSDEMHPTLRRELTTWDKNKDGAIDLKEFVAYYREHALAQQAQQKARADAVAAEASVSRTVIESDLDRRPEVIRAGKLPAGLPEWFQVLDTNGDGQVSLAEWRKADKTIAKFKELDRNDDGYITPEEALRYQQALDKAAGKTGDAVAKGPGQGGNGGGLMQQWFGGGGRGQGMRGGGKGKRGMKDE